MWVYVGRNKSVEIDDEVIREVINFYPEEKLSERRVFQDAYAKDRIEIKKLKEECEKIHLPWQLFFLTKSNLKKELSKIESNRKDKFSSKHLTKRKGLGDITSKRILDRLVRIQNYIVQVGNFPNNRFCGSLKGMSPQEAVEHIISYFEIDLKKFRNKKHVEASLEELISKIQQKNINISRGVLSNGILLHHTVVKSDVYKNTCGFAIKDAKVPFIFLPNEINPDEVEYRQIYTLIYLLTAIGLDAFDYFVESDFKYKKIIADKNELRIHKITSEFLLPSSVTDPLKNQDVDQKIIDNLKVSYKLSPTAVVTTLKIRGVITKKEYDDLKPEPFVPTGRPRTGHGKNPKITTSVNKFCGKVASTLISTFIKAGALQGKPAQYMLFGRINKTNYEKYLRELKI